MIPRSSGAANCLRGPGGKEGGTPPLFFVSAHSKGLMGAFFVSAHSKGLTSLDMGQTAWAYGWLAPEKSQTAGETLRPFDKLASTLLRAGLAGMVFLSGGSRVDYPPPHPHFSRKC